MTEKVLELPPIDPALSVTLGGFLREVADRFAEREALNLHDLLRGGERVSWSYAELYRQARDVARALIAAGVGKGTRVGILLANRPEFVAALFGTAMAGGIAVTLSTYAAQDELAQLLELSEVDILLTQAAVGRRRLADDLAAIVSWDAGGAIAMERFPFLRRIVVLGERQGAHDWAGFLASGAAVSEAMLDARAARAVGSDTAVIIFTSGTTTLPKGVVHVHRTLISQFRWQSHIYGRTAGTRIWSPFPLFWSAGIASVLGSTLAVGGCWVGDEIFEPGHALKLIASERVTEPYGFPTHTAALADHPNWAATDFSALRCVRGNNEFDALTHTSSDPAWNMIVAYGMSESCTSVVSHLSTTPVEEQAKSMGLPLPGIEIRIAALDGSGVAMLEGWEGEICVRGPTIMTGYVGMSREDCFDADGFFHTGDTGFVDAEGFLHWTGRIKNMIKTGGANVSAGEVEEVAAGIAELKLCRVIGVPDDRLGEMVVLCTVPEEAITEDEVRARLRAKLASYKVPRRVLFFDIGDYPLTSSGKVKLQELRELVLARL